MAKQFFQINNMKRIILENPAAIFSLTNEELEQFYWETIEQENDIKLQVDELKAQKDAIKQEFIARVKKINRNGLIVNESSITVYPKVYTNNVTIETARNLGVTKMEEKIDTTKLGNLVKSGAPVEGAEVRTECRITKAKKEEENV